ncbi:MULTISPECIES: hypothetical protein [Tsukamurella]|uniref:Permease n=1 Tax=Tsukamurella strandjordii TaxID=147577 RepID=A0AA90SN98_9ACTN|nr:MULTISPECIES: hypothetical protein [Tsukamurella]MDP0400028.1 hypothetical protein [Tsukamurella strandjordii]GIZ97044.1 hypothetical protein TTY48_16560 [Tsukamurella sp. TY48]
MNTTEGSTKHSVKETVSETAKSWLRKAIAAFVLVGVLIAVYFGLSAFIPRWWAQQVGRWVDSSMTSGTLFGLGIGFASTAVPLLILVFAARRVKSHPAIATIAGVLAVAASVPNLMTLSVVIGVGSGANAGRQTMNVDSPGFRGATLIGVIVGALFAVALAIFLAVQRKKRAKKKQIKAAEKEAKAAAKQAEKDAKAAEKALKSGHAPAASSLDDDQPAQPGSGASS